MTAVNPFIGYRSQPERGLSRDPPSLFTHSVAGRDRLPVVLLVSYNVREISKANEGVWKETTESAPTLQLSRMAIGKRHKKWHITAGSDNGRFRRDANISTTPTPKADSRRRVRRRQMQVIRNKGLCSEAHDGFISISDRNNYCLFYLGIN